MQRHENILLKFRKSIGESREQRVMRVFLKGLDRVVIGLIGVDERKESQLEEWKDFEDILKPLCGWERLDLPKTNQPMGNQKYLLIVQKHYYKTFIHSLSTVQCLLFFFFLRYYVNFFRSKFSWKCYVLSEFFNVSECDYMLIY